MRIIPAVLVAIAAMVAPALAGGPIKQKDLVGVWEYVHAYQIQGGQRFLQFGERPQGYFVLTESGHYSHFVMADEIPRVASGNIKQVTDAEAQAIATNSLPHFGTFTVDEKNGKFTVRIKDSSFRNFKGVSQTRTVTKLTRTELEYENPVSTAGPGAVVYAKLRRVGR